MNHPHLAWKEIDQRVVILDPNTSSVHELNESASSIWLGYRKGLSAEKIINQLIREFDVDPMEATRDVTATINLMKKCCIA